MTLSCLETGSEMNPTTDLVIEMTTEESELRRNPSCLPLFSLISHDGQLNRGSFDIANISGFILPSSPSLRHNDLLGYSDPVIAQLLLSIDI
ncbi:hypothetical protein BLNAU_19376 [Blattamonas nauphoetae]|uniref:Uncharacterized protein n=1 Tax=Blattamonas nauphoetae TaxID=2049346 RepID=A0ABQ9X1P9_9EUKA|nr:hypothetical protein BLNAU_19376 [Blattamonas nauphoetae]